MAASPKVGDLCRLCGTDTLNIVRHAIFEGEGLTKKYAQKISECLPLQIAAEDPLPKNMCGECCYKLDLMSDFREKAVKTEVMLVSLVEGVKPEIPDEDDGPDNEMDNDDFRSDSPVEQIEQQTEPEVLIKEEEAQQQPQPEKRPGRKAANKRPIRESDDEEEEEEEAPAKKRGRKPKDKETASASTNAPKETTGPLPVVVRPDPGPQPVIGPHLYQCRHCRDLFTTHADAKHHIREEHKFKCALCKFRTSTEEELEEHKKGHQHIDKENLPRCCICLRSCVSREAYKDHLRLHVGSMPFECDSCDKLFPDKSRLERHILRHVDPSKRHQPLSIKKPTTNSVTPGRTCKQLKYFVPQYTFKNAIHECSICFKKFKRRDDMRQHKRKTHTRKPAPRSSTKQKKRPALGRKEKFECPCGKLFNNREQLLKHRMKLHPDWVHKCRQCDRIFNTPIQLACHTDKSHPRTTYKCSKCNETLKTMVGMYNHRTKGCRMPKLLSKMLLKVPKVEPGALKSKFFNCSFCQGRFAGLQTLEDHINLHLQKLEENEKREASRILQLQTVQNDQKLGNENEKSESTATVKGPDQVANAPAVKIKAARKNEMKRVNAVQCPKCDKNMPPTQWKYHSNLHNNPDRPKCATCNYVAASETKIKEHMQSHADVKAPFFCSVCHLNFRELYWAEKHVIAYHGSRATVEKRLSPSNVGERKNSVENMEAKNSKNSSPSVKKCTMCMDSFFEYPELNLHMMETHMKKQGNHHCPFCDTKLESFNLMVTHLKLQHGVNVKIPRSCEVCHTVLNNSYSLNRHMHVMHPECPFCKERQAGKASLVAHVSMKHSSMPSVQSAKSETPNDLISVVVKQELQETANTACLSEEGSGHEPKRPEQSTLDKLEDMLKAKLAKDSGIKVEATPSEVAAGTSYAEPNGNLHLPLQLKTELSPAKKQSKAKQNVPRKHKSKKQPVEPKIQFFNPTSPSETSNSSTSTVDPVTGAAKSKHPKKTCNICSARFKTHGECRSHLVNLHNMCCNCDKMFDTQDDLQKHIENHPISICPICSRTLNKRKDLQIHISRAHQDSSACSVCFIVFDNHADLKAHYESMHLFMKQCPVCNHFMNQTNVTTHMRKHDANIENFSCKICQKEFKNKSNLDQHMRIHTGAKPYQCPVCPEKFIVGPKMVQHVKHSHGFNDKSNLLLCPWCKTIVSSITELGKHVANVEECRNKRDSQGATFNSINDSVKNGSSESKSETK